MDRICACYVTNKQEYMYVAAIIREELGHGIMSSTDCHVTAKRTSGSMDENRVTITFNARFSPHLEQYMGH